MVSSQKVRQRQERIAELSEGIGRELATKTMLFHSALADRLGLGATDLKCLDLLRAAQVPLTASNLVLLTGLTGGAITGVADRLEAAGFVERVRDPADRRRWELRPKPDRQDEIAALFAPLSESMNKLCSAYNDDELNVLAGFLTGLGAILDDQTERLRHLGDTESTQSD
jgi:DNA-binding MarR family transcriptional regulator